MYHNILIAMSLEHGIAPRALSVARALLAEGGKITALHVYEKPTGAVATYIDESDIEKGLGRVREMLERRIAEDTDVTPVVVTGHSARSVTDYARENKIDCIVVGAHKPGLSDYFLGGTASRIVRHAGCSVHVLRE